MGVIDVIVFIEVVSVVIGLIVFDCCDFAIEIRVDFVADVVARGVDVECVALVDGD